MVVSFCGYFYIICPANNIYRLLGLDIFPVCRPLCFFVSLLFKNKFYSLADCFLMTSSRETCPTVCIESVTCGCNVVGFNVGGVPETIPQGMGEVVEPFDMDAYEKVVRKWADIKASEEYINKLHFDWAREEMTRKYIEVYKRLLNLD